MVIGGPRKHQRLAVERRRSYFGFELERRLFRDQLAQLVANAKQNSATVGSDLVPTHSGLGPDCWLAARGYKDVNLLAFKLLRPGGALFTFSCSGAITASPWAR